MVILEARVELSTKFTALSSCRVSIGVDGEFVIDFFSVISVESDSELDEGYFGALFQQN